MAFEPSGLDFVPGLRLRIIDANLQGRKATLQLDGTGLGAFSGVKFGLGSSIDFKAKPALGSSLEGNAMSMSRAALGSHELL